MNYLFDTDTISNLLKKRPSPGLVKKLQSLDAGQQFISTITVMEIVYGACKSAHKERHLDNLENILLPNVNVLSFDLKASYVCGNIQADLEKSGIPLYLADLQIASITMANELTLVSGNTKHFKRIKGLLLENWL